MSPEIVVTEHSGKSCPRCKKRRTWTFYDNLCGRCLNVMLIEYPNHPKTKEILATGLYNDLVELANEERSRSLTYNHPMHKPWVVQNIDELDWYLNHKKENR